MTSTLTSSRTVRELAPERPLLFDTMQAVIQYRRELQPVPARLIGELRDRHLGTLVEAIERYNERVDMVRMSA